MAAAATTEYSAPGHYNAGSYSYQNGAWVTDEVRFRGLAGLNKYLYYLHMW